MMGTGSKLSVLTAVLLVLGLWLSPLTTVPALAECVAGSSTVCPK